MLKKLGNYDLVRELGAGGFATTYEAVHRLLKTRACIKVANTTAHSDLFLAEARILWDLHHPSLPTLREVFRLDDGRLALVMRFVEGATLEAVRPIDSAVAVQVLGRLLQALRLLHHRGIVHNDIKPENIILEPDRHGVVLVDFGVSTVKPRRGLERGRLHPLFVAPEVAAGLPPLPESDLYSLAVSLLYALGGDIERRILPTGAPEPLLQLLVSLSRKEPERRPRWDKDDPLKIFEGHLLK